MTKLHSECLVVKLYGSYPRRLYNIHYESQFLGTVAGRSYVEAFRKAKARFGSSIIKDVNLLEVTDSGKFEGGENGK